MSHYQECALCGIEGPQIRVVLVEWLNPKPRRFDVIPRCDDTAGCRSRVKASGESWPLAPTRNENEVPT